MILISLDEGGRFEQLTHPQCMLIGGLAFQCENQQDIFQESKCLEYFFRTVCAEQQGRYPEDLHPIWGSDGEVTNVEAMARVKSALADEMQAYLQKKGRWAAKRPAHGNYYVYCMLGDQRGLENTSGNLRDNIATVRYDHMIYRTIENILFYNPYFRKETEYTLHLPTRVVNINDKKIKDRDALKAELVRLGYRRRINRDGSYDENVYEVTDETSFRTCLESALLNSDRKDLQFDLMIQSISYSNHQPQQMFLYLADTLCSVYQDAIYRNNTTAAALPVLTEKAIELAGPDRVLVWAYHPSDRKWRKIWKEYLNGSWFESLQAASEMHASRSAVDGVYRNLWLQPYEKAIAAEDNFPALSEAVFRLDQYMLDLEKRKQGTGMYIMKLLKENYTQIKDDAKRGRLEYRLSKIMTGLYNHRGDYENAEKEYKKCIAAARYVPIEEFLGLQLFYSVLLCDSQQFEKAETVAANLVSTHELLNDIKEDVYPESKTIYDSYGRALSQHGQCLAFLGRHEEAVQCFRKALDIFEAGSRDWNVTGSYLLHDLIEQKSQETYEEFVKDYFTSTSIKKQFTAIMNGKCGKISFALYIFLKGLWTFYTPKADPGFIREIIDKVEEFQLKDDPSHPWEQIMKYCAFLQYRYFETDTHEQSEALLNAGKDPNAKGILKVIAEENEKQYQHVIRGEDYTLDSQVTYTYR